jgi:hypothetical protein
MTENCPKKEGSMGYRILLKERDIKVRATLAQLDRIFPKADTKGFEWRIEKTGHLMIAANTETGWIGFWCRPINKDQVEIYHLNASRSFYSRNGSYFLRKLTRLIQDCNGNCCISTKEPGTGGGSLTIIYQGKLIHGVFTQDLNHKQGYKSIWAEDYEK